MVGIECGHCGQLNELDKDYCTYCGAPLRSIVDPKEISDDASEEVSEKETEPLAESSGGGFGFSIVGIIVALVVMAILIPIGMMIVSNVSQALPSIVGDNSTAQNVLTNVNTAMNLASVLPIILGVVIVLSILFGAFTFMRSDSIDEPSSTSTVELNEDIIKPAPEIVEEDLSAKWVCKYCGTINSTNPETCVHCGAPRKKC